MLYLDLSPLLSALKRRETTRSRPSNPISHTRSLAQKDSISIFCYIRIIRYQNSTDSETRFDFNSIVMDAEKPDPTQNSDPNNRLHPEDDDIKFEISKKQEGSSKECVTSPSSSSASSSVTEESVVKFENGVVSAGNDQEEENDGFRTPTSAKHRIPVITECPPAPKKPESRKRQVAADDSPADTRKRINLSEEEFRTLFSPQVFSDFGKEVEDTGTCGAV